MTLRTTLVFLVIVSTPALARTSFASTTVCGDQFGTWTVSGSPYFVDCDVTVPIGTVLTIDPGVTVLLYDGVSIDVDGQIVADGTADNHIVFDAVSDGMTWHRLFVNGKGMNAPTSTFRYCDFANAQYGVYAYVLGQVDNDWTTMALEVSNSTFAQSVDTGIYVEAHGVSASQFMTPRRRHARLNPHIESAVFDGGTNGMIVNAHGGCDAYCSAGESNPIIYNTVFANLTGTALRFDVAAFSSGLPEIVNNSFIGNDTGISVGSNFDAAIKNNAFHNHSIAIDKASTTSLVEYNDFFGSLTDCLGCPASFGDTVLTNANGTPSDLRFNIFVDPAFVSASDFHLSPVSLLIDAGTATGAPPTDIDGEQRLMLPPDIGADEGGDCPVEVLATSPESLTLSAPSARSPVIAGVAARTSSGGGRAPRIDPNVFRRFRDEVLSRTPAGRRLTGLYNAHSFEMIRLLVTDSALRSDLLEGLSLWQNTAAGLADGSLTTVAITPGQARIVDEVANTLVAVASPGLRQAVQAQRRRTSPGLTLAQALLSEIGHPSHAGRGGR